jgi:hypothetical protein
MHSQIVMDHTGDTRHTFDPTDDVSVEAARRRFIALIRQGYAAAKRTGSGTCERIKAFDPTAAETLFIPQLVGG